MNTSVRVLVVDDDPKMVRTLVDIFRAKGHAPRGALSGAEALQLLAHNPFDCVVTDMRMEPMDGLALFRALRGAGHATPVVFMTAYADEDMVRQGLSEGALGAITKPFDLERLLGFLGRIRDAGSVLIIDDDLRFCATLRNVLESSGYRVDHLCDPRELADALHPEPHAILLDMRFDRPTGLDILREIRRRSDSAPVILVTGYREQMRGEMAEALRCGVRACLDKPVNMDELLGTLAKLRSDRLRQMFEASAEAC